MKKPSQYHIQKRKDGRYAVTVMHKGKRQTVYGRTKKETLEKLTKVVKEIQYAKIQNLKNLDKNTLKKICTDICGKQSRSSLSESSRSQIGHICV